MEDLFSLPMPPARDVDTSRDAARSMAAPARILRDRVLGAIRVAGFAGLTADEAARALGVTPLAVRPRCTELREAGLISDSGKRRKNASGRNAAVWITRDRAELL